MADSKRKRILLALEARLKEIRTFNDYNTDAGQYVSHGRRSISTDDQLPRLILVAGELEPPEKNFQRDEIRRWALSVHGLIRDDVEQPLLIEDLVADIKKAIFQADDVKLGDLVQEIESLGTEVVTDPEEGGQVLACAVPFVVVYDESYGEP